MFKKALRYIRYYGLRGFIGLAAEKLLTDPRRSRLKPARRVPDFPPAPAAPIPGGHQKAGAITILYAVHCFFPERRGGTERFVLNLARKQQRLGNRVRVLTMVMGRLSGGIALGKNIFYKDYEFEGVPVTAFSYKRAPLGLYYKRLTGEDTDQLMFARFILDRERPDLVHAAYPQPFAPLLALCRARGLPYVATLTDFCLLCHYATMLDKNGDFCPGSEGGARCVRVCKTYGVKDFVRRHALAGQLLLGAGIVSAPSDFVARVFCRDFPGLMVNVVPHGIDAAFCPGAPRSKTRRFVYAGTLTRMKNVHLLLEAWRKLAGDIELHIYGGGDQRYEKDLRAMADRRVFFHGPADASAMPEIYRGADCVVVPSIWYETYNFVMREALACGCLVVVSRIGAMPEAVDPDENGFLFSPGDLDALLEALRKALDFDWNRYKQRHFPGTGDEARAYEKLYLEVGDEAACKRDRAGL